MLPVHKATLASIVIHPSTVGVCVVCVMGGSQMTRAETTHAQGGHVNYIQKDPLLGSEPRTFLQQGTGFNFLIVQPHDNFLSCMTDLDA